ncbi:sam-dependent methyltransferase [Holotrichia oblita]|uniref:Sam-dependent methyltransferase n=1 Tax=Holotrichia oblita TaxID=644536 RepID=A0ACB9TVJ7_HOLOL|nr:sam-dependent methyltransferase [Holotrichia oblita]
MHEVITIGGEFTFVSKIIDESSEFQDRIRIYTSMLGIKRNVKLLLQKLHKIPAIKSAISTEFHQGNTTRFGIAWTFDDCIQLEQLPISSDKKEKCGKPYVYNIKPFVGNTEEVGKQFTNIFNDLQLKHTPVKTDNENVVVYDIIAHGDTWSHSRRKRRELAHSSKCQSKTFIKDAINNNKDSSRVNGEKSAKRKCDYVMETVKRVKTEENIFLACTLIIHISSELHIELVYVNGSGGKNACHQILQYFKNHLKF